jgi:predicted metal-dependent enzyme (double-stranded beta helix superfamily)
VTCVAKFANNDHRSTSVLLHAPTPLSLADLAALTRNVADEVRAGRYPVHVDPACRWYRILHTDDYVDVWLISWATEQSAELHDHGGSLGALAVVSGNLVEQRWVGDGLRSRQVAAGCCLEFPLGHVHDVGNSAPEPAVSVHAYSPPLTAMSYYAVASGGRLRRIRSVLVEPGSSEDVG